MSIKRAPSASPPPPDARSTGPPTPSTPSTPSTLKKAKATGSAKSTPTRERVNWTADEDAIFVELMLETLKEHLFPRVKADGRLNRQNSAVRAHLVAFMNKLKKISG